MDKGPHASEVLARQPEPKAAAFISCDIVGHSAASESQVQLDRVAGINEIIAKARRPSSPDDLLWASGGDGGHAIFRQRDWHRPAVDLVLQLRRWASSRRVPLRITAHYGQIYEIEGADGRTQPVGDGINMAGWILSRGSNAGIMASAQFRTAVQESEVVAEVEFHDPRTLQSKSRRAHELCLMSFRHLPELRSRWEDPSETDRQSLEDALQPTALQKGSAWDALYYAKRIMQLHTTDTRVEEAMQRLGPAELTIRSPLGGGTASRTNPFLGYLQWPSLQDVVQLGELIERHYNEVICHYGDSGDTMFVILRGQVGVFKPGGQDIGSPAQPAFALGAGEIVGELAFALNRDRTADLVALSETALLSFNYEEVDRRLARLPSGPDAKRNIDGFMKARILEHTCHQLPYLIGKDRSGPLTVSDLSWESLLQRLLVFTEVLACPDNSEITIEEFQRRSESQSLQGGIYVLVSGQITNTVKSGAGTETRTLRGVDFPLLYVDLPDRVAIPGQRFRVEEDSKVLHIAAGGIYRMPPSVRNDLIAALKREVRACYPFDAFLSYNNEDEETMRRWKAALTAAGLRVYSSESRPLTEFLPEIEDAILRSLTFLAFISSHTVTREPHENWVIRESRFRQEQFDLNACILPILLPGGRADLAASGYSPVDAVGNEADALRVTIEAIRNIKAGGNEAPFGRRRQPDLRL
jgi:hypothetical protein